MHKLGLPACSCLAEYSVQMSMCRRNRNPAALRGSLASVALADLQCENGLCSREAEPMAKAVYLIVNALRMSISDLQGTEPRLDFEGSHQMRAQSREQRLGFPIERTPDVRVNRAPRPRLRARHQRDAHAPGAQPLWSPPLVEEGCAFKFIRRHDRREANELTRSNLADVLHQGIETHPVLTIAHQIVRIRSRRDNDPLSGPGIAEMESGFGASHQVSHAVHCIGPQRLFQRSSVNAIDQIKQRFVHRPLLSTERLTLLFDSHCNVVLSILPERTAPK